MGKSGYRILKWVVRAGVSIGLIVLLLMHADLDRVGSTIADMHIGWFLLAVAIKGIGILAGIVRWRLMLLGQEIDLRLSNLGGAYLVGRFFGSFLPSTIGLDAYRTYYAAVRSREVAKTVAVTVVEKVIGLLALSVLAMAALPFGYRMLNERATWVLGLVISAPIVVALLLLSQPRWFMHIAGWLKSRGSKFSTGLARMSEAVARYGTQRGRIAVAILLGFIIHGATSAMYLATAKSVGADIATGEILFIGPLMIAATLVPISIAGIGVREGTYVFFLSQVGVPTEQAVLLGFLGFMAGEVYSLAGGAAWALTPAARPEDGHGLIEVVKRAADWVRRRNQPGEEMSS
jgi:glycosyltransferase 2 family protein